MKKVSAAGDSAKFSAQISRRRAVAGIAGFLLVRSAGKAALAAPQTFIIFFDKNSADVSASAKPIVAAIKGLIKPTSRATIVGHCDTSESEPDKLSLARANAVLAALKALAPPAAATLSASGKGTAEPQKQTGPNESEPVNRYVSITVE